MADPAPWRGDTPPFGELVEVGGDDYMGQWTAWAKAEPYKRFLQNPPSRWRRKHWRWVWPDGSAMASNDRPTRWRHRQG
jgi:hypothetical protein